MRIDTEALAEWSRTLDRLPPLADEFDAVEAATAPAGLPAAELYRANVDALRALADVMASLDSLVDQLRAAATVAMNNYSSADERAASLVGSRVRRH